MTRVNPEHLEQRRQQILGAAQRCFTRKGLHGTSMEEIFLESGLSADEVSHYFQGKDDLVEGIHGNIMQLVSGFFDEIRAEDPIPPLDEVVERFANSVIAFSGPGGPGPLVPVYWGAALYNEKMAERARMLIEQSRTWWIEIAERESAAGNLVSGSDPRAVGTLLVGVLPGILLQHLYVGDVDTESVRRGVQSILGQRA